MFQQLRLNRPIPHRLSVYTILVAGTLLPFLPHFLLGTVPYEDDLANYFWPVMHRVAESLRAGRLPLWTPNLYTGFPLFADSEAGTLFPLNWLLVVFNQPVSLLLLLYLSTALSTLCMYAFVRHLRFGYVPAIIAAWVFALGGFATGHLAHISISHSALPTPLILLAIDRALCAHGRRQIGWLLVAASAHALQWLGGHIQPPIMTWLLAGAYLVFRLAFNPMEGTPERTLPQKIFLLIAIPSTTGIAAFGLAAAQLLPTLELAASSARALGADYAYATSYSFPPPNLLTLIWPYFFQDQSGVGWGLWSHWETAAYVGILPLMLAVVGLIQPLSRQQLYGLKNHFRGAGEVGWGRNRLAIFFVLIAVASLWLALADYAPLNLHRWFYDLPLMGVLRAPARFMFLFDFALAVLAANGAQWLFSTDLRLSVRRARVLAGSGIAGVVLLISADFIFAGWIGVERDATTRWLEAVYRSLPNSGLLHPAARLFDFLQWAVWLGNPQFAWAVVLLIASAWWLTLTCTGRLSLCARQMFALLLVGIDLSIFAGTFWRAAPMQTLTQPDATTQFLLAHADQTRVFAWAQSATVSDRLLRWDVPDSYGYSSFESKRQAQVVETIQLSNNRLLDLAHVGWVVLPSSPAPPVAAALAHQADVYNPRMPLASLVASSPLLQRTFVLSDTPPITSLHIVSALEHAPQVQQGETVARIIVHDAYGGETQIPIRAGIETAEWALERADVKITAQHQAAPIAYSFHGQDDFSPSYTRHLYRADLAIQPRSITSIELAVVAPTVHWLIYRCDLLNDSQPVASVGRFNLANFELVSDTRDARVYRNQTALPRAWLVARAQVEPDAGKWLRRLTRPQFDPSDEVLLEEIPETAARGLVVESAAKPHGSITLTPLSDEHVHVSVQTNTDAFLVLADTWYEGWQARDNGVPTKIYRADYLYRAVFVSAGQHEFDFVFEPQSVRVGFLISAISVLCVGYISVLGPVSLRAFVEQQSRL